MSTKLKIIACLIFLVLSQAPVKAQFFLSYDVGVAEHDVQIHNFGENHYGVITPSFLNFGIQFKSEKSRWSLNMSSQKAQLNPNLEEIDYFEGIHYTDQTVHHLSVEYLREVFQSPNNVSAFLGTIYSARHSTYTNVIQSEVFNYRDEFEENVVFDLSLIGAMEYKFNKKLLSLKTGAGVFNYRLATNKYWREGKEFYGTGPSLFLQLITEVSLQIPLTHRIYIEPEYAFKYHRYRDYSEMRALQQHFLIGGVFRL